MKYPEICQEPSEATLADSIRKFRSQYLSSLPRDCYRIKPIQFIYHDDLLQTHVFLDHGEVDQETYERLDVALCSYDISSQDRKPNLMPEFRFYLGHLLMATKNDKEEKHIYHLCSEDSLMVVTEVSSDVVGNKGPWIDFNVEKQEKNPNFVNDFIVYFHKEHPDLVTDYLQHKGILNKKLQYSLVAEYSQTELGKINLLFYELLGKIAERETKLYRYPDDTTYPSEFYLAVPFDSQICGSDIDHFLRAKDDLDKLAALVRLADNNQVSIIVRQILDPSPLHMIGGFAKGLPICIYEKMELIDFIHQSRVFTEDQGAYHV